MQEVKGNIWDYHRLGRWVVVTTNGDVGRYGAIMGAGVAKRAANEVPSLPQELGAKLAGGNSVYAFSEHKIVTLPTKHSWRDRQSDLALIERSLQQLVSWANSPRKHGKFYLTRPGCGNGKRNWDYEIRPICAKYLDDRFVVVNYASKDN